MASSYVITCCICEEVYNLEERKPLLLPCSHTFCRSCLQQMMARNNCLCPVCRASWGGHIDSLPFIRQLAVLSDRIKSPCQNVCDHRIDMIAWCKGCKVSSCFKCLKTGHRLCDWVSIKEQPDELIKTLQESVVFVRAKLVKKFTYITIENNSLLADIKENIRKMKNYEKVVELFLNKLSVRQENIMNKLEKFENLSSNSSVTELSNARSTALSFIDNPIISPMIPKIVLPDYEEPADDSDSEDEWGGVVSAELSSNAASDTGSEEEWGGATSAEPFSSAAADTGSEEEWGGATSAEPSSNALADTSSEEEWGGAMSAEPSSNAAAASDSVSN